MAKLFVVRHGEYNLGNGVLTKGGEIRIRRLGENIKLIIGYDKKGCEDVDYKKTEIVCSSAERSVQSAGILASLLNILSVDVNRFLHDGWDPKGELYVGFGSRHKMEKLVDDYMEKFDNLIMVTHGKICSDFGPYFAKKRCAYESFLRWLNRGEAYYFNLEDNSVSILH